MEIIKLFNYFVTYYDSFFLLVAAWLWMMPKVLPKNCYCSFNVTLVAICAESERQWVFQWEQFNMDSTIRKNGKSDVLPGVVCINIIFLLAF